MKRSRTVVSKFTLTITAAVLAVVVALALAVAPAANAAVDTSNITSWTDLKTAIEQEGATGEITIGADLYAENTITVPAGVVLKGKSAGITIYQKQRDSYDTMFKVDGASASLTLGENLTLSGKTVNCAGSQATLDTFAVTNISVPGNAGPETIVDGDGSGVFKTGSEYLSFSGDDLILSDTSFNFLSQYQDTKGYLYAKIGAALNGYVNSDGANHYKLSNMNNADVSKSLSIRDKTGAIITNPVGGETYYIYDPAADGFLAKDEYGLITLSGQGYATTGALEFNFVPNGTTYYVVPGTTEPKYTDPNDSALLSAMTTYNQNHPVTKSGWRINGQEFIDPDERELAEAALAAYNSSQPQGCDSSKADCPKTTGNITYTSDTFASGSATAPHGFFVQAENGGTVKIHGATLENFITSGTGNKAVQYAAPVVVNNGTFDMNSGSIQRNSVGYTADNNASTLTAEKIGYASNTRSYKDSGKLGEWERTNSAGAVILTGGATGSLSGTATLSDNRGDVGAIIVQGSGDNKAATQFYSGKRSALTINGANVAITKNVGVHYSGAILVFNGGYVKLENGTISNNFSWNRGGALWVSEEVYGSVLKDADFESVRVADATFIMQGGEISGNHAVQRGGAINVSSEHVALFGGSITNNTCRVLGGAIYVEGDGPKRNYRLYINQGDITANNAVDPRSNNEHSAPVFVSLSSSSTCDTLNTFGSEGDKVADAGSAYNNYVGHGGGIWLCAIGGNASIVAAPDAGDMYEVFVGNNHAYNTDKKWGDPAGQDVMVRPFRPGKVNGLTLVNAGEKNEFRNELTGEILQNGNTYSGRLGLTNNFIDPVDRGVLISGNTAANGGGIAANGTIILGKPDNEYLASATLSFTKDWSASIPEDQRKVIIELYPEGAAADAEPLDSVRLNGIPDTLAGPDDNLDFNIDLYSENTATYESDPWVANFGLPLAVSVNGKKQAVAILDVKGQEKDPSKNEDIREIIEGIQNETIAATDIKIKKWNLKVREFRLNDDGTKGEELEFKPLDGVQLGATSVAFERDIYIPDSDGHALVSKDTQTALLPLSDRVANDIPAEIEKYVNEAVHENISLDKVFTYDILAYVTMDADKVVIEDQLVDLLEFANKTVSLSILETNNHKPYNNTAGTMVNNAATVHQAGTDLPVSTGGITVDAKDTGKLTVTIDDGIKISDGTITRTHETVKNLLRGKWIKVSFDAQIKKDIQDRINAGEMTVKDRYSDYVTVVAAEKFKSSNSVYSGNEERPEPNVGNQPVESSEDHTGIENTASYTIDVANKATYKDESNTVTVKPDEPTLEKYVNQAVHKNINLDEVFTYDIIGFITSDADKVVFEDQLVDDLEFADNPEVKLVSLDANNHKPYHNIDGEVVNADASVHEDGTSIAETTDGVSIDVDKATGKLTVTIDDEVKESGGELLRTYHTVKNLRGKYVKITFKAQIKKDIQDAIKNGTSTLADLSDVSVAASENAPVESSEAHHGIKNDATLKIEVANQGKYDLTSNKVTVKPELPEIEKYVNTKVHQEISIDETFTYDVVAFVTSDADSLVITDTLNEQLEFASAEADVAVAAIDNASADHTPETGAWVSAGSKVDGAAVTIDSSTRKLTVSIADAKPYRGQWIKVTFDARIAAGLTIDDLSYTQILDSTEEVRAVPNKGNDPVISDEDHEGVPNTASYTIEVGNDSEAHSDTSNTVTVKPRDERFLSAEASTVTKTWEDGGNTRDRKPVEFQLQRSLDGGNTWENVDGQTITLTEKDEDGYLTWTGHFDNLPAYENRVKLTYRVVEANTADFEGFYTYPDEEIMIVDVESDSPMGGSNQPNVPNTGVEISKQKVGGGPELPGAKLTVYKIEDGKRIEIETWTSGKEPHLLSALEPGIYVLKEVTAPDGYEVAEEMTFRVNVDGTVELQQGDEWMSVEDHIVMFDAPKKQEVKPHKPNNPTLGKKTAKTSDTLAGPMYALALLALAAGFAGLVARRRSRKD